MTEPMLADRGARTVGLTLGVVLGLALVWWLTAGGLGRPLSAAAQDPTPTPAEEQAEAAPAWLFDLPAEPAPPADPDAPAAPAPVTELAETR